MKLFPLPARHVEAITFSAKATLSALAGVQCYRLIELPGSAWVAAVSAVIVTQPKLHSSLKASLLRVAANLAGAFGSATLLYLIGQPVVAMAVGIMFAGLACYAVKQDDMLRPAFVAVILVTLAGEPGEWHTPLNRVAAVLVGCTCAVAVGFLFNQITPPLKPENPPASGKAGQQE